MGVEDKFNNSTENTTGKVKEGVGRVTDNERLETEGRADQTRANVKQAGEKIKDAFRS
ncbi:CsbD family protein [Micromonospora sp. DT229]|uniref:CsbD family protein n=1 Tax=Micromonospora sp. DT229 TaxID=3393430 RepID=UPI003CF5E2FF